MNPVSDVTELCIEEDVTGGRALATIRRIAAINPIEGADKIEVVTVDGWDIVVAKDVGYTVGQLVVYFEIDSLLPVIPAFEFLRERCYIKNSMHGEGFRLRTIKLRKQISQGLVLPTDHFFYQDQEVVEGDDVTKLIGVKKYEKVLAANLAGVAKGNFPSFIPKTDEDRIQNRYGKLSYQIDNGDVIDEWEQTIKLDGTSFTAYVHEDVFGVCSRNLDLTETESNIYWQVARKYNLEVILRELGGNLAIQGEIVGPGIQSSYERFDELTLFVFNMYDTDTKEYLTPRLRRTLCEQEGLLAVPVLPKVKFKDFENVKGILAHAEGPSVKQPVREGVVWKNVNDPSISFKAISQKFLLSETHD